MIIEVVLVSSRDNNNSSSSSSTSSNALNDGHGRILRKCFSNVCLRADIFLVCCIDQFLVCCFKTFLS